MNARTLTIFRLYQLFNGIVFTGPIWAVFLLSRGLSLTQFGLVASRSALRRPDDARAGARHGISVARRGITALRRSPRLAMLTIAWSIYWSAFTSAWFYAAPFFEQRGATDAVLGFALGGGMLAGAAFSWAGGRIAERVPLSVSVGVSSLIAVAGLPWG